AAENSTPPLSSGPFRFREWMPNDHVTLVRNDRFFLGPPLLDTWVYKVIPDQTGLASALRTGEVDVAQTMPVFADELRNSGITDVLPTPGTGYTFIAWNQLRGGKEFLRDKAVRHALSFGINWDAIIQNVFYGQAHRVVTHTPTQSWAFDAT